MHKDLDYIPTERVWRASVTAYGNNHILVAERKPPAIHVHNLNGEKVHHLTHQDLGVQITDYLLGIRCNNADEILHVAFLTDNYKRWKLCAYKVQRNN